MLYNVSKDRLSSQIEKLQTLKISTKSSRFGPLFIINFKENKKQKEISSL